MSAETSFRKTALRELKAGFRGSGLDAILLNYTCDIMYLC